MDPVRLERQLEADVLKARAFGAGTLAASASKTAATFARPRANTKEDARSNVHFGKPSGSRRECDMHFTGRTDCTDAVKTPGTVACRQTTVS